MKKFLENLYLPDEALKDIRIDGTTSCLVDLDFQVCRKSYSAIKKSGSSNLKVISTNAGTEGYGFYMFLENKATKVISSYVGEKQII